MTYKYTSPTDRGYEKFKISKKDQNRIFKYRKATWSCNYEFYLKDKSILMYKVPSLLGCIVSTLLFPLGLVWGGIANYKETYRDMIGKVWFCKKYGSFSSDEILKRDNDDGTFDRLIAAKT